MLTIDAGVASTVKIALTNLGPTPVRPLEAEKILRGSSPSDQVLAEVGAAVSETPTC